MCRTLALWRFRSSIGLRSCCWCSCTAPPFCVQCANDIRWRSFRFITAARDVPLLTLFAFIQLNGAFERCILFGELRVIKVTIEAEAHQLLLRVFPSRVGEEQENRTLLIR